MISESVLRLAAALGPEELASAIDSKVCSCGCKGFLITQEAYAKIPNPTDWGIHDLGRSNSTSDLKIIIIERPLT